MPHIGSMGGKSAKKRKRPWYSQWWMICVYSIFGLIFLSFLFAPTVDRTGTILMEDVNRYSSIYQEDLDKGGVLRKEWVEVVESRNLYAPEGYITRLGDIAGRYVRAYEFYAQHKKEYITFLEENKDDLELYLVDFSVIERKRGIQDNDLIFRNNIQMMSNTLESLAQEAQKEDYDVDLPGLLDIGVALAGLLI